MDPDRMLQNWNDKVIQARIQEDFTARLPTMTARFTNWTVEQAELVAKVKAVLSTSTATITDVQKYCAFAMKMYGLKRKHSGNQLKDEAALEIAKWTARGCIANTLAAVRDSVFGVAVPS